MMYRLSVTKQLLKLLSCAFVSVSMLAGCATTAVDQKTPVSSNDPYESINRKVHGFNNSVDTYVAKPVADVYSWAVPDIVQTGIFNFFNNLKDVNVVINDLLQAKFAQGAEDAGRFVINTTIGLGGFVDVAKDAGLDLHEEDFDQTLAVWGVPTGPYVVLPLVGPTTVRGMPSAIFDTAANPASWIGYPILVGEVIHRRAKLQSAIDATNEALDPYLFIREAFLQNRYYLATDGKSQVATDIDNEISDNAKIEDSVKVEAQSKKPNYALQLTADTKEIKQMPSSINTTNTFDKAAEQFENASRKMNTLKNNKK